MTFWNVSGKKALEPKRNYRFRLSVSEGSYWWWAKTVDKPSFDVSNNEYQLINHKFKYPGIVTWKPISITVVDTKDIINLLYTELEKLGYMKPSGTAMVGLAKEHSGALSKVMIEHLDEGGNQKETWTIYGAFITSLSMSKLDYSNDDLSEITIEITYDYAELQHT